MHFDPAAYCPGILHSKLVAEHTWELDFHLPIPTKFQPRLAASLDEFAPLTDDGLGFDSNIPASLSEDILYDICEVFGGRVTFLPWPGN